MTNCKTKRKKKKNKFCLIRTGMDTRSISSGLKCVFFLFLNV